MVTETDLELEGGRTLHVYDTGAEEADGQFAVFWHRGTPMFGVPPEHLFAVAAEHERLETSSNWGEQPGFSVFLRDGDEIYHTYSTFARGDDHLSSITIFLDLTPLGRQESRNGGCHDNG